MRSSTAAASDLRLSADGGGGSTSLHGHHRAPFSTKLARTSVRWGVHLNALLLDHATRAARG